MNATQTETQFVIRRRGLFLHRFTAWSASWAGWMGGAMQFDEATAERVLMKFEGAEKVEVSP